MRSYDCSSARSADAANKSVVAKPSVNRSSTGANSSYASEERFWLWWKRAQLVAVLNSQARAPCARANSSDLRKRASADIILSGPSLFKSISAVARSVSAAHQTLRPCSARATASELTNSSESVLSRSRSNVVDTAAPGKMPGAGARAAECRRSQMISKLRPQPRQKHNEFLFECSSNTSTYRRLA